MLPIIPKWLPSSAYWKALKSIHAGLPRLLEVNPNPGWCWDGHLAKMAKIAGMSYAETLAAILKTAEQRLGLRPTNGKSGLSQGLCLPVT